MPDGCPKKNGSANPVRADTSHPPTRTVNTPICNKRSSQYRRCSRTSAACSSAVRTSGIRVSEGDLFDGSLIGDHGLVAQVLPNPLIQLRKMRIKADLCDVARSGQVDGIAPFQRRWRVGEDMNAVGKRYGIVHDM